ncbi:vesicle-associated membrane protein 3-like [Dysidea avara]|uniref:vesicle-associated membrane protein 3-like n=1 Tax=Dysidea avara TaxID=196820 RepID=UPI00332E6AD7
MPPKFKRSTDQEDRVLLLGSDGESDGNGPTTEPRHVRKPQYSTRTYEDADTPMKRVQNQVTEVIDVMKDNIGKVLDRGEKLSELESKSEDLADSATQFKFHSTRLQKKMWWQNCKLKLILCIVIVAVMIIIITPLAFRYIKHHSD